MRYKIIKLKDIKQSNCVKYTKSRKELSENFISEGYDVKKGIIIIDINNKILNGNHRYCLLLQEYGGDHKIEVKQRFITYNIFKFFYIISIVIIFPFFTVYQDIKKIIKK